MTKLAVIIVNWNTKELTRNCLLSLGDELKNIDSEIWIVDNASSDDSVGMIKSGFPQVQLIENCKNVGFARANNQALRTARADNYLLLNSDTIIPKDSIEKMLNFFDSNPKVAACAPRLLRENREILKPVESLPSIYGEIKNCVQYHFFPFDIFIRALSSHNHKSPDPFTQPVQMEILSMACLLLRKDTIEKVGYLGEEYFLFSEENDYFTRMRTAKLKSFYLPNIEVIHLVGMSRKNMNQFESDYNYFKSRILYFEKYCTQKLILLKLIYRFFFNSSIMTLTLWNFVKRRKNANGENLYKLLLSALDRNSSQASPLALL